ncbi:MAG TPA: UDP-N-acetylmuramyl-tripeptide synthetase [Candidatus Paceibacterota bacterium]|nr:UDP-N-acetylmuramyl-tripeptide synthetase [Candidatus Paceibacterota bacterium]
MKNFLKNLHPRSAYHFLWAWTGAHLHRHPSKTLFVIGVTGTKGKTTTLELINAILEAAGKRTALISSLRVKVGEESKKNMIGNSMPGRGYLQKFLRKAKRAKCNYALIEVTSQAVVQHRHRFIHWNMGALTNLAPEHIEAHGSFENYRAAKLDFLEYVIKKGGKVFLNRDDKNFDFFMEALKESDPIASSKDDEFFHSTLPGIRSKKMRPDAKTSHFLMSPFNEENIAVAVAIAKELGIGNTIIENAISQFEGVPGRMEFINDGDYTAVVDYAHTPESLEAAYAAAKPKPSPSFPKPRLICVLGAAGGGRDTWKRPAFGAIAGDHCDEIILTNEDPYDEDPQAIMNEIESGIPRPLREGQNVYKILDRAEAIDKAVALAREGDVVIGTGKGSEDWIHIAGGRKIPWNERAAFEAALKYKKEAPLRQ